MNRSRNLPHPRTGPADESAAARRKGLTYLPLASAISAVLAGAPLAHAQQKDSTGALEEVVVTAQKKSERMQDVPVAIVALGTEKLEELKIQNLDDYVKYLPSVAFSRGDGQGGNGQPGSSHVYMRGVVSGANENHSGSQPSVGTYLDEQPVTTIDGTVDVHIYDIARVEVLEGPQGTLYGASSQAGTIRIITNKPDPAKFSAGYDLTVDNVYHGGVGYGAEGFVNIPLSPSAAIRLVGWDQHSAGFIDNIAGNNASAGIQGGLRTYPSWCNVYECNPLTNGSIGKGTISNSAYRKNDYNTADTQGGRAALKLNLGENWTVTPTVMGQSVTTDGFFGYDPGVGDLQIVHFGPENSQDSWVQGALTVEGKFANFDLVYAGAFMKREIHSIADYADYSWFYDTRFGSGALWVGQAGLQTDETGQVTGGTPIMPQELVYTKGHFEKWSHELRLTTPQDLPVKGTVGVFIERQLHNIWEQYIMPGYGFTDPLIQNSGGLAQTLSIPTLNNTIWLTDEQRVDRDQAAFAQVTWDITQHWSVNLGYRYFKTDNSLAGFYGYSSQYQNFAGFGPGMNGCFEGPTIAGNPCSNLDKEVKETGHVPRANVTWKINPDAMLYATYSKGFRPGGVNRNGDLGPYAADYLTNYEFGWKTQWLGRHLRWNGSIFQEDWNDFQFSFLGPNSLTIITNGGTARIRGIENELEWSVGGGVMLSLNASLLDPRMTTNYCGVTNPDNGQAVTTADCTYTYHDSAGNVVQGGPSTPQAPAGSNLPIAPKFKGNAVARYNFSMSGEWDGSVQAAYVYQTQVAPALKTADVAIVGMQPAYGMLDLSGGVEHNGLHVELFITNVTDKRAEYSRFVQSNNALQPYVIPAQPRTVGLKFGQKF
ncbi:MAG TPA: TonB-dependent receptor [Steroidobacteraceae bacterium]|nr:TonB-dependent receptor [Steroidobacteraceae bacterium]